MIGVFFFLSLMALLAFSCFGLVFGKAVRADLPDGSVRFKLSPIKGLGFVLFTGICGLMLAGIFLLAWADTISSADASAGEAWLFGLLIPVCLIGMGLYAYFESKKFFVNSVLYSPQSFTIIDFKGCSHTHKYEDVLSVSQYAANPRKGAWKPGYDIHMRNGLQDLKLLTPMPIEPLIHRNFRALELVANSKRITSTY